MNNMQILCMDAAGEPIFRTPCSVGSGEVLTDAQVDAAVKAWFAAKIDFNEPNFLRTRMRAAIAAATEGAV